ncbi:MAG: L,D-transpeptidase family protein [Alphaproteobacteria bacterium]|nr:L,D-transpeptidase family protein [Alphaproteobacteria bacterium]
MLGSYNAQTYIKPYKTALRLALVAACLSFAGGISPAGAQIYDLALDGAGEVPSSSNIQNSLEAAVRSGKVGGNALLDKAALQEFYTARNFEPYWMSNTGPYSRAHELITVLEGAWTHGLNPETYHASDLRALVKGTSFTQKDELELMLSDGFIRYARDLSGMRVDPAGLETDPGSWRKRISAPQALAYLTKDKTMGAIMRQIEPQGQTYKTLQKELIRLSGEPDEEYNDVLPIRLEGLLRPGQRSKAVPAMRKRLGVSHDGSNELVYDDRLMAAVIRFQRENDLVDDGVIGSSTLELMNRTNQTRAAQIVANLERLRWVENERPDRFVVVNIPAATLWAIDDGRVDFEMPVIVGKPVRPTQSFITKIEGVRFNPDWTIPPTIKRFDILPKLTEDPGYLHKKGIQLIRGHGDNAMTLDPFAVEWSGISSAELNSLRMVQVPGETNPLGRVRILMPNIYNIYLHDTNHPEYFDEPARAVSSGCIRMKEPEKMADFVLEKEPSWRRSTMQAIFDSRQKTDIPVSAKMPVYVLYYTAWTDSKGRVVYGADIYNQDSKLLEKLSNIDGFYIPRHNENSKANSGRSRRIAVNQ